MNSFSITRTRIHTLSLLTMLVCLFFATNFVFGQAVQGVRARAEALRKQAAEARKSVDAKADRDADKQSSQDAPQSAEETRYTTGERHKRHGGSGRYYMGREIAMVMSWHGAPWLERPEREREEKLSVLIDVLGLKPGMVVADIGTGSGVIAGLVAPHVKPDGKVLAVDIQKEMLERLKKNMQKKGITNVVPVLGTIESPKLEPGTVDLAVMVDVYHEFSHPYEMTRELAKSLKPGGRIAFVEYRMEDETVPILLRHKMSEEQVKKEAGLKEFGLRWKETLDDLPRQHIVIFERVDDKEKTE